MTEIVLAVLFGVSLFLPFYTYVLYPLLLSLPRGKKYSEGDVLPSVTAIVCFGEGDGTAKRASVEATGYPGLETVVSRDINAAAASSSGEILVFLDHETELDPDALRNIVKLFADKRVAMVVGEQTSREGNGAFWKYETKVRRMESKFGSVSGANASLFAIRRDAMPTVPEKVRNIPFYLSAKIKQNGGDVVYCPDAKTYEKKSGTPTFRKRVSDAAGYWQAFGLFPGMLFFRRGSFVYVGHRVLKWFVWLDLTAAFLFNAALCFFGWIWIVLLALQAVFYLSVFAFSRLKGGVGGIFRVFRYFLAVSFAFLPGMFVQNK